MFAALVAGFCPGPPARAQTDETAPREPQLTVSLISWQDTLSDLFVGGDTGPGALPASAPEFALGSGITFPRHGSTVVIFRRQLVEGEQRTVILARAEVPQAQEQVIILLAPAPAGSAQPFQSRVLDDSPDAHPAETIRLFNYSSRFLALRIGQETFNGAPGSERLFSYTKAGAPRIFFQLAAQTDDGWKMVRRYLQAVPKGRRLLCIVRDGRPVQFQDAPPEIVDAVFILR
ncbi:MAG: hypothetical protein WC661_19215 [Opitutaceae bacterium]